MAKQAKKSDETASNVETTVIHLPADFVIEAHGHKLDAAALAGMSAKAVSYLVANGYKQSLTDAAAFTKEQKDGKSAAEVESMAAEKRAARHAAILAGEVGSVGGTRATPLERFMRDVAEELIRAACVKKGVPMWKGTQLTDGVKKLTSPEHPRYADIKAEAESRMAQAKGAAEDVEDILG